MEISLTFSSGLLLGLAAGLAPGPLLTLVISQSLRHGIKEGIKVAVAPVITDLPIIGATLLLVAYLQASPWPLGLLSCLGALFILRLAVHSFAARVPEGTTAKVPANAWYQGALINLLNPHPYLFWLTVGTPFLAKAWGYSPGGALLWVFAFYAALVGSKIALAVLAGKSRAFLNPRILTWINRALGVILVLFAIVLARDGLRLLMA
jgi:threonine/homoserine/homoserine lactone efflux protein